MAESEPTLTVAICTRNRRDVLLRALASLAQQRSDTAWDVLVVENATEDDTRAAVESIAGDFPVPLALASEPVRGLSAARNRALAVARARAVVYLDDDATCRAGWVAAHAHALAQPDVLATGGPIVPVLPSTLPTAWRAFLASDPGGPTGHYQHGAELRECGRPGGPPMPFGGNLGLARVAALESGGFRTDLGWGVRRIPCEETELLQRLAQRRGRILYVPDAAIDHHVEAERVSPAAWVRWHRALGRAHARLDPPRSAGERIQRTARHFARAAWWSLRGRSPFARRECAHSLGHALELLRGD